MSEKLKKALAVALASTKADDATAKELIDIIEKLIADVAALQEDSENEE